MQNNSSRIAVVSPSWSSKARSFVSTEIRFTLMALMQGWQSALTLFGIPSFTFACVMYDYPYIAYGSPTGTAGLALYTFAWFSILWWWDRDEFIAHLKYFINPLPDRKIV